MSERFEEMLSESAKSQEQSMKLLEKLFAVAQPDTVFGKPISAEGQTIITASEVRVGLGLGFGSGLGMGSKPADEETPVESDEAEQGLESGVGVGTGGGGGGASSGRPIAVISVDEEGVKVEPVVDVTKIGLAFFTTLGSMFFMLSRMRRASRG